MVLFHSLSWCYTLVPWPIWHKLYYLKKCWNFQKLFLRNQKILGRIMVNIWEYSTCCNVNFKIIYLFIWRTYVDMAKVLWYSPFKLFWAYRFMSTWFMFWWTMKNKKKKRKCCASYSWCSNPQQPQATLGCS